MIITRKTKPKNERKEKRKRKKENAYSKDIDFSSTFLPNDLLAVASDSSLASDITLILYFEFPIFASASAANLLHVKSK